jgi:hypothetical protein
LILSLIIFFSPSWYIFLILSFVYSVSSLLFVFFIISFSSPLCLHLCL